MLYYDDASHKYWDETDGVTTELTSVTQLISRAKKEFNTHMVAGSVAKKTGRDQKEIVAEWKLKGDIACDWGNAIHKTVELWVKHKAEPKTKYLKGVLEEYKKLGFENDRAEMMIYDLGVKVAGRMDLIDGVDIINIRDIKTSAGIEDDKKEFTGVLKNHIGSKLDEYTLQLSIYAYILEQKGHKIGELSILEWDDGFRKIDVPYRPDLVKLLIENY